MIQYYPTLSLDEIYKNLLLEK